MYIGGLVRFLDGVLVTAQMGATSQARRDAVHTWLKTRARPINIDNDKKSLGGSCVSPALLLSFLEWPHRNSI
jgi:hypothetical protein